MLKKDNIFVISFMHLHNSKCFQQRINYKKNLILFTIIVCFICWPVDNVGGTTSQRVMKEDSKHGQI